LSDECLLNESFFNESGDPANLTNSQRGQLAEIAFLSKAAGMGLSVAKPWNERERYDFIVRVENTCWRVQVKSVVAKARGRGHYRIKTSGGNGLTGFTTYSANEIDFLVAYIFPENVSYVFPAAKIAGQKSLCLRPGSRRSVLEEYREAWKLMKPQSHER